MKKKTQCDTGAWPVAAYQKQSRPLLLTLLMCLHMKETLATCTKQTPFTHPVITGDPTFSTLALLLAAAPPPAPPKAAVMLLVQSALIVRPTVTLSAASFATAARSGASCFLAVALNPAVSLNPALALQADEQSVPTDG
jgi:hypothetical protein